MIIATTGSQCLFLSWCAHLLLLMNTLAKEKLVSILRGLLFYSSLHYNKKPSISGLHRNSFLFPLFSFRQPVVTSVPPFARLPIPPRSTLAVPEAAIADAHKVRDKAAAHSMVDKGFLCTWMTGIIMISPPALSTAQSRYYPAADQRFSSAFHSRSSSVD